MFHRPHVPRSPRRLALALALLAGVLAPSAARAQLTIDQLELQLDPGALDRKIGVFSITNEGTEAVQVALHAEDWDRAESGENRFFPLGTQAKSCGERLSIFPLSLRLEPGATGQVRVSAEGLAGSKDACWEIVFAELARPPRPPGAQRAIIYVVRTGVKVYVEPSGLGKDGEIENVQVVPHVSTPADRRTGRDLVVAFRNSGGMSLHTTGTVEFRRPDNSIASIVQIADFPTLPGAKRNVTIAVPPLAPGRYTALAMFDFGGSEIAAGQIELQSP